jgi:GntR family transcriptional regulator
MTKPVHVSIRDDLRMRITVGEWAAGDRLPSETDLAARYGVARMTVRQAIGALAGEGIVVRRQGLGTFAAERLPPRRVGALLSFTEEMHSQGRDVQSRLVKTAVEQPTDLAREALQLAAYAATVTIQRVRVVDSYPIAVQHSWLPCARFAGLDAEPLLEDSLYATIEGRYGVRIMRARQVFTATVAGGSEAELLELKPGSPVLRITRTTYDGANCPVEFAMSAMRPESPIETMMERASMRQRRARTAAGRAEQTGEADWAEPAGKADRAGLTGRAG